MGKIDFSGAYVVDLGSFHAERNQAIRLARKGLTVKIPEVNALERAAARSYKQFLRLAKKHIDLPDFPRIVTSKSLFDWNGALGRVLRKAAK